MLRRVWAGRVGDHFIASSDTPTINPLPACAAGTASAATARTKTRQRPTLSPAGDSRTRRPSAAMGQTDYLVGVAGSAVAATTDSGAARGLGRFLPIVE